MPVVLAIEPDAKQASILKRVVRERARSEVTVVDSKDAAIAAIGAHIPDLILVTALISPRDEEELISHLRTLGDNADHLQTITIPLLAPALGSGEDEDGFFSKTFGKKKKRKKQDSAAVGCDPWTFAEQVAGYVKSATDLRAARQAELEYAARYQAPALDAEPASATAEVSESALVSPDLAASEFEPLFVDAPPASEPEPVYLEPAYLEPETVQPEAAYTEAAYTEAAYTEAVYQEPVAEAAAGDPLAAEPAIEETPVSLEPLEPWLVPAAPVEESPAPLEPIVASEVEPIAVSESVLLPEPSVEPFVPEPAAWLDPSALEEPAAEIEAAAPLVIPEPALASVAPAEPVYETPPERVFEPEPEEPPKKKSRWRKILGRPETPPKGAPAPPPEPEPEPEPVVVEFRPLKRLPPLVVWARLEEVVPLEPEPKPTAKDENDISDLFASLRVPPHVLPVTYPHRPHVRRVRAA